MAAKTTTIDTSPTRARTDAVAEEGGEGLVEETVRTIREAHGSAMREDLHTLAEALDDAAARVRRAIEVHLDRIGGVDLDGTRPTASGLVADVFYDVNEATKHTLSETQIALIRTAGRYDRALATHDNTTA